MRKSDVKWGGPRCPSHRTEVFTLASGWWAMERKQVASAISIMVLGLKKWRAAEHRLTKTVRRAPIAACSAIACIGAVAPIFLPPVFMTGSIHLSVLRKRLPSMRPCMFLIHWGLHIQHVSATTQVAFCKATYPEPLLTGCSLYRHHPCRFRPPLLPE